MSQIPKSDIADKPLIFAIMAILIVYGLLAIFHLPQMATEQIVRAGGQSSHSEAGPTTNSIADLSPTSVENSKPHDITNHPPYWMAIPFMLLLGAIAVLPLISATSHWWENNLHRFYVAGGLAAVTLLYYLCLHGHPIHANWPASHNAPAAPSGLNLSQTWEVFANAIFSDYVPFIVLLFSLYTISGGIRIVGDLPAHPLTNSMFLLVGAILASFIGTTGAAMVLIRPLLETNSERKYVKHTVIFFIFIVCNCGGCLLPLGDPPLFLGYLKGVPFLWTCVLWKEWLFVNGILIVIYWIWDHIWYYPHETPADIARDEAQVRRLTFSGLWPNVLLLAGVILSVGMLDPSKTLPGTNWHPWLYLREAVQLGLVALSLLLGSRAVREANSFNYAAIIEVAALFFGIFICMQPPLQVLAIEGPRLGLVAPWHYFWATGSLSSVLDNAPTYVVFFETAKSLGLGPAVAGVSERLLVAISLGSVFMGANTYIGNGPNFMVKSIAEKSGVPMPSFFGYMLYSFCFLIPIFVLTTFLFL